MKTLKIYAILICLIATSNSFGFTYNEKITVGLEKDYLTIQEAIDNCSKKCEIEISSGVYKEQITVNKDSIWIHGDLNNSKAVTIQYLDTLSTYPQNNNEGDDEINLSSDQNGVVRIKSQHSRLSHVTLDAVRKYAFQWTNISDNSYSFHGNSGITFPSGTYNKVDHCEIKNAWYAIYINGNNTGGVFANLENWEIKEGQATIPFSDFGKNGGHIIEYNKIYDNVWGFFLKQIYDLGSTFRYNLLWDNYSNEADFICNDTTFCGNPDAENGNKKYHTGGFMFVKNNMLVTQEIYGNTTYNTPQFIAGYYKAGKNFRVYNNIIARRTAKDPGTTAATELLKGNSNATNNVIEANSNGTFPLFRGLGILWTEDHLAGQDRTAEIDSFAYYEMGADNFYYKEINFLSTNPTDDNFLCPDWSDVNVQRAIEGNILAYTSNLPVGTIGDAGALWKNGVTSCIEGGSTDSIGIFITPITPIISSNTDNATFQFDLSTINSDESDFTDAKYSYKAYIDSIPDPNIYTAVGIYIFPKALPLGNISEITKPVNFGINTVDLSLSRSHFGEYGIIYIAIEATNKNGNSYRSNVQAFEYRRLNYTIDISLYAPEDIIMEHKLDTVTKGDTVVILAKILDLYLEPTDDEITLFGKGSNIDSNKYVAPKIVSLLNNSFQVINQFDSAFSISGMATTIVTGNSWELEILNISGYTLKEYSGIKKYNFASGIKSVFILPAYASKLEIESNDTLRAGDTITVSVKVKDILGDICEDSIAINLKSDDLKIATIHGLDNKINTNGTVEFQVILVGATSDTLSLTATATSEVNGEIIGNFSIPIEMGNTTSILSSDNLKFIEATSYQIYNLFGQKINIQQANDLLPGKYIIKYKSGNHSQLIIKQ